MKKPTSIVPVDTNFGSVINTKSMEMNDPIYPSAHIGRVSPSPFLFTRIQAKVDAIQDVPQQMGWVSWVRRIGVLHADIQQIHFAHFLDIQKICKPEQQDDFALLTKDLSKMFRGRAPKGNADGGQESKRDGGSKSEAP